MHLDLIARKFRYLVWEYDDLFLFFFFFFCGVKRVMHTPLSTYTHTLLDDLFGLFVVLSLCRFVDDQVST